MQRIFFVELPLSILNLIHVSFLGCGFIGRNFVSFLVKNDFASAIRVVDKVPPQVAWLNKSHTKAFNHEMVEFKSANLINPGRCISCTTELIKKKNVKAILLVKLYFCKL